MIELVIPEATPSLNRMLGGHWSKKHQTRNHWWWLVKAARLDAKVFITPNYDRARITVERTGARILDSDNCMAGLKFMIDGLVHEGLIAGDTPAHIGTPVVRQFVDRKLRRTVVRIESITEAGGH